MRAGRAVASAGNASGDQGRGGGRRCCGLFVGNCKTVFNNVGTVKSVLGRILFWVVFEVERRIAALGAVRSMASLKGTTGAAGGKRGGLVPMRECVQLLYEWSYV